MLLRLKGLYNIAAGPIMLYGSECLAMKKHIEAKFMCLTCISLKGRLGRIEFEMNT